MGFLWDLSNNILLACVRNQRGQATSTCQFRPFDHSCEPVGSKARHGTVCNMCMSHSPKTLPLSAMSLLTFSLVSFVMELARDVGQTTWMLARREQSPPRPTPKAQAQLQRREGAVQLWTVRGKDVRHREGRFGSFPKGGTCLPISMEVPLSAPLCGSVGRSQSVSHSHRNEHDFCSTRPSPLATS